MSTAKTKTRQGKNQTRNQQSLSLPRRSTPTASRVPFASPQQVPLRSPLNDDMLVLAPSSSISPVPALPLYNSPVNSVSDQSSTLELIQLDSSFSLSQDMGDDSLICTVCFRFFRDPVILPCGHTFCMRCTNRLVLAFQNYYKVFGLALHCPTCGVLNDCSEGLKRDKIVADFVAKIDKTNLTSPLCQNKCGKESVSGCEQCRALYCAECFKEIHSNKLYSTHNTVELQKALCWQFKCKSHHAPYDSFCVRHECFVCCQCVRLGEHQKCRLMSFSEYTSQNLRHFAKYPALLRNKEQELGRLSNIFLQQVEGIAKVQQKTLNDTLELLGEIIESFDVRIKQAQEYSNRLHNESNRSDSISKAVGLVIERLEFNISMIKKTQQNPTVQSVSRCAKVVSATFRDLERISLPKFSKPLFNFNFGLFAQGLSEMWSFLIPSNLSPPKQPRLLSATPDGRSVTIAWEIDECDPNIFFKVFFLVQELPKNVMIPSETLCEPNKLEKNKPDKIFTQKTDSSSEPTENLKEMNHEIKFENAANEFIPKRRTKTRPVVSVSPSPTIPKIDFPPLFVNRDVSVYTESISKEPKHKLSEFVEVYSGHNRGCLISGLCPSTIHSAFVISVLHAKHSHPSEHNKLVDASNGEDCYLQSVPVFFSFTTPQTLKWLTPPGIEQNPFTGRLTRIVENENGNGNGWCTCISAETLEKGSKYYQFKVMENKKTSGGLMFGVIQPLSSALPQNIFLDERSGLHGFVWNSGNESLFSPMIEYRGMAVEEKTFEKGTRIGMLIDIETRQLQYFFQEKKVGKVISLDALLNHRSIIVNFHGEELNKSPFGVKVCISMNYEGQIVEPDNPSFIPTM